MFRVTKRALDIALSAAAILFLLPLLVIIAVIIKHQDGGPVFFTQLRVGRGGEEFRLFKFRSMRVEQCDTSGVQQTVANDVRITRFGTFLRRSSIDELPQLLNILRGDMSIVGPRPHVRGQLAAGLPYAEAVPEYELRHAVRPGLTGLAQVNGFRGPTHDLYLAQQRVQHDIDYIRQASIGLDLSIIARTAWNELFAGKGF